MNPKSAGADVNPEAEKPQTGTRLDPAVVADLYQQHAEELRAFLSGVLRDRDAAAEALQVTFAKAVEAGHTAHEATLRGWLFKVAFNEAMNLRRRREMDEKSCRQAAWIRPREGAGPDGAGPEDSLARREVVEAVRQVLTTLPPEQQQVVRMRIYDEKTFAEIAAELKLPLGTVLSRMRLALKKIQERLPAGPLS